MSLRVGRNIDSHPGLRLIQVVDQKKQIPAYVFVSDRRMAELENFFERNPAVLGDGIDVMGRRCTVTDINEAYAFFISTLAYSEALVREPLAQPMQARQLMTFSAEAGPAAESIRYEKAEGVGVADWGNEEGDDVPFVDEHLDEASTPIKHGRVGYRVNFQELRRSAFLRRPIDQRRFVRAQEAAERGLNKAALFGVGTLPGFLTQTGCTQTACGSTGLGASLTGSWDTETAEHIQADINLILNAIYAATAYQYVPTGLRVPPGAWQRFVSMRSSTYSDLTMLDWLRANNICKATSNVDLNIGPLFGADTAGAATTGGATGSHTRVVAYVNSPSMIKCHVPMPLQFNPPQVDNLSFKVIGEQRFGGVEVPYTGSMIYVDKVLSTG